MIKKWIFLSFVIIPLRGAEPTVTRFALPVGRSLHITFVNDNDHTIVQYNHNSQTNLIPAQAKPVAASAPCDATRSNWARHPWAVGLGAIACGYAALFAYLTHMEWSLASSDSWAAWKEEVPLDALRQLPAQQLAGELFAAIQDQYKNVPDAHFLTPLIYFMQDADQELAVLQRFDTVKQWCSYLRLTAILPAQKNAIAQAHEKMERLAFFKELILAWLADYSAERTMDICQ